MFYIRASHVHYGQKNNLGLFFFIRQGSRPWYHQSNGKGLNQYDQLYYSTQLTDRIRSPFQLRAGRSLITTLISHKEWKTTPRASSVVFGFYGYDVTKTASSSISSQSRLLCACLAANLTLISGVSRRQHVNFVW